MSGTAASPTAGRAMGAYESALKLDAALPNPFLATRKTVLSTSMSGSPSSFGESIPTISDGPKTAMPPLNTLAPLCPFSSTLEFPLHGGLRVSWLACTRIASVQASPWMRRSQRSLGPSNGGSIHCGVRKCPAARFRRPILNNSARTSSGSRQGRRGRQANGNLASRARVAVALVETNRPSGGCSFGCAWCEKTCVWKSARHERL